MAHFAQINKDQKVEQVIVIANENCGDGNFPESEPIGQTFIASLGISGLWLQTSFNNRFRKNFAGIGYEYLKNADVFIAPQPFESWKLNSSFEWEAPKPYPNDGESYFWNEDSQEWIKQNEL